MEITLEDGVAAVVRYVQDHSEDGTQLYFEELPENFCVPSVYFQSPTSSARKATLSTYNTPITLYIWFMDSNDWRAYDRASGMRDELCLDQAIVPLVDKETGEKQGKGVRVYDVDTRRIDEGIMQLSLTFDVYFSQEEDAEEVNYFHFAVGTPTRTTG